MISRLKTELQHCCFRVRFDRRSSWITPHKLLPCRNVVVLIATVGIQNVEQHGLEDVVRALQGRECNGTFQFKVEFTFKSFEFVTCWSEMQIQRETRRLLSERGNKSQIH